MNTALWIIAAVLAVGFGAAGVGALRPLRLRRTLVTERRYDRFRRQVIRA